MRKQPVDLFKSIGKTALKILVSGFCLWWVGRKINWSDALHTAGHANAGWLCLALILFVLSKWISAIRLNIYFSNAGLSLPSTDNTRLYWLGMFYNLFLPGGIGGDAYKVILLKRHSNRPVKLLSAAVLLDRVSGVTGLGILALLFFGILRGTAWWPMLILPGITVYYFVVRAWFPSFLPGFFPTLWLGLLVQALQVFCAWCLASALHVDQAVVNYLFIFLLSSIVAILPFTIGGLGARELAFLWGAHQFALDRETSVAISLLFYLITVVCSLPGLIWVYRPAIISSERR